MLSFLSFSEKKKKAFSHLPGLTVPRVFPLIYGDWAAFGIARDHERIYGDWVAFGITRDHEGVKDVFGV